MNDAVNRPAHYVWLPVEPIEILEHLLFNRGAACKYIIRAGRKSKDTEIEDLEKARWHIQRELERLKGEG